MSYEIAECWVDLSYEEQQAILETLEDDALYFALV